ncbi:VWA domain-containing protein [Sphingomonas alpina]|uniref:VWA domain-containing protein n=1 Tax=Sphingomonas alpina TaxID=653931 RepID=A0A7H0LFR2_9SPHN|nr:VWA domain-containing protein [Sphingomonas alpina]QNQ08515.1 VWA domain-containing protein [Sphingomonas alpina]
MNEGARIALWQAAWPDALAAWSRFTRLRDPRLCDSGVAAAKEGLAGAFAMIRLVDKSVVIDLEAIAALQLDDHATEILAHEIGHHVLAPASATDSFRLIARLRRALPTLEHHAPMVANLYTDLLINDRLQRQAGLDMAGVYRRMASREQGQRSRLWGLYVGIYESLWGLEKSSLGGPRGDAEMEGDAWLGARLIRVYARDWMFAAGRFATLLLPYLAEDAQQDAALRRLHDTRSAALGADPSGAQQVEGDEADGVVHPSRDVTVTGVPADGETDGPKVPPREDVARRGAGQAREPFDYGEILRAAGLDLTDEEIAIRYYRERALPLLVPFPTRPGTTSDEPQLEGVEPWSLGDALDEIDWLQTAAQSPVVIPGVTTVRRVYGREPGPPGKPDPVDLDLYVDSSGSMPDPRHATSFLTLAGAVIALSALKAGSRVQATLWSGKNQWMGTNGFVRDEAAILAILVGYYGGGTAFPIHRLRDTFAARAKTAAPAHILMISDDGITTMFDTDERGASGWDIAAMALAKGRAGGTMALNLGPWIGADHPDRLKLDRAEAEQGWDVRSIDKMEDLVEFARSFSRRRYADMAA